MKCHVVVEGKFDAGLLGRILEANHLTDVAVSAAGDRSSTLSFAQSLLATRRQPVALLLDANTLDEPVVEEQEQIYYDLLRSASRSTPFRIFSAVPSLDVIFFSDLELLSELLGHSISPEQVREARFRPRAVLEDLLRNVAGGRDRFWLLTRIDAAAGRRLARHPLVKSVISFVRKPTAWAPEGRAA